MSAEEEVRHASKQFYAALNRMANGDAGPMASGWSHGPNVTAHSLKTKYALAALAIGALVAVLLAAMLFWQYRMDSTRLTQLAQSAIEPRLVQDLQIQANRIAQQAAPRLARHVRDRPRGRPAPRTTRGSRRP